MSDSLPLPDVVPVEYDIAGSSDHSGTYVAENVLVDRPRDQTSRWSGSLATAGATANAKQWIRLRLRKLSVLSR